MVTLVTGATGLVGNNLVRMLLERGTPVRVLSRGNGDSRPLAGLDVEMSKGDVRDGEAVKRAVRGAASVVHAAAYVHIGWSGLDEAREINVEGTRNVAAAARAAGVPLVHVSSLDALGSTTASEAGNEDTDPDGGVLCPYVVTKRESERVVMEYVAGGLDARIVNPGFIIGPYDWKPSSGKMLLQVAKWRGLFAPLGGNQFCDVRDVVAGILAALERGTCGRRYILGGHWLSYFQAWRVFAYVSGGLPPVFPAGPLVRIGAGRLGDAWGKLTGREPAVNSAAMALSAQQRYFSSARAETELGLRWRPLHESAAAAWQWFRENGYA